MSSVNTPPPTPEARIPAAERREQILTAASEVFGARGYIGATTDQIARAAGISQPYVVRMFGTKERLFVEVIDRARDLLLVAFRDALAARRTADAEPIQDTLGNAYLELVRDRGVHLSLMQAFLQGGDPVVGAAARSGFLAIWRLLRTEAGFDADQARDFLAFGMLINVLLGIRLPDLAGLDADADALLLSTGGEHTDLLLESAGPLTADEATHAPADRSR